MPNLRLPSLQPGITAHWLVPKYTAWWQRHTCVNNLLRVALDSGAAGIRTRDLSITSLHPTATPPSHCDKYLLAVEIWHIIDVIILYSRDTIEWLNERTEIKSISRGLPCLSSALWCQYPFWFSSNQHVFPSVLWHCWLGDRKGIRPEKNWVLVCCWWHFNWSFAHLITPVVTNTSIILSTKWNPEWRHSGTGLAGSPGKGHERLFFHMYSWLGWVPKRRTFADCWSRNFSSLDSPCVIRPTV